MKKKLSIKARRIKELVKLISNDSQRDFARRVGCSHSTIAKIANGQRDPGKDIMDRIAQLPCVNPQWLESGIGRPLRFQPPEEHLLIPVARSLLPGIPADNSKSLTSEQIALPLSLYQPTRYAIRAIDAIENRSIPPEILPQDMFIIETASGLWNSNIQALNERYTVVQTSSRKKNLLQMAYLRVDQPQGKPPQILNYSQRNLSKHSPNNTEPLRREVMLDAAYQIHENTRAEVIDPKQICGLVVQLIRNW